MLGIVVDDAIIVGENIYRHQEEHGDGLRGAIEGAREIARPVTLAWPRGAAGARIRLHPPRRPQPRRQRHRLRRCHRDVGRGRHRRPSRPHPPRGARPPSRRVFYTFEGVMAEQRDVLGGLQRGFVLALLLIFALLAVPLRSYVQPSSS